MISSSADNTESPSSISNSSNENRELSTSSYDEQHRKLFIGGLSYTTLDDRLK